MPHDAGAWQKRVAWQDVWLHFFWCPMTQTHGNSGSHGRMYGRERRRQRVSRRMRAAALTRFSVWRACICSHRHISHCLDAYRYESTRVFLSTHARTSRCICLGGIPLPTCARHRVGRLLTQLEPKASTGTVPRTHNMCICVSCSICSWFLYVWMYCRKATRFVVLDVCSFSAQKRAPSLITGLFALNGCGSGHRVAACYRI